METDALYRERMTFRFIHAIAFFIGLVAAGMLGLVVYHFTVKPIDNEPGIGWLFIIEFFIMAALTVFVMQFRDLDIILTYQGIIIKFGRIKKFIPWIDIQSYNTITEGLSLAGGGWHIGPGRGGWSAEYTVIGKPRLALKLNAGIIRNVVFSTGNPQEVSRLIKKQTGKDESR